MSTSASIPATVQIRRSRLLGLIAAVAALAAAVTWLVLALVFDDNTPVVASKAPTSVTAPVSSGVQTRRDPSIMSMTPSQLAGVGLGTAYALPSEQSGPTAAALLASMSPRTRRYTERIMGLTFAQLAAGAAGSP
jgi:hypothetical protein